MKLLISLISLSVIFNFDVAFGAMEKFGRLERDYKVTAFRSFAPFSQIPANMFISTGEIIGIRFEHQGSKEPLDLENLGVVLIKDRLLSSPIKPANFTIIGGAAVFTIPKDFSKTENMPFFICIKKLERVGLQRVGLGMTAMIKGCSQPFRFRTQVKAPSPNFNEEKFINFLSYNLLPNFVPPKAQVSPSLGDIEEDKFASARSQFEKSQRMPQPTVPIAVDLRLASDSDLESLDTCPRGYMALIETLKQNWQWIIAQLYSQRVAPELNQPAKIIAEISPRDLSTSSEIVNCDLVVDVRDGASLASLEQTPLIIAMNKAYSFLIKPSETKYGVVFHPLDFD